MDSSMTLFVNAEPLALGSQCPADLRKWVDAARQRLLVVTEMTERAVSAHSSALLTAAATARGVRLVVAFDDAGVDPTSLAMLPFAHPDAERRQQHGNQADPG